MWAGCGSEVMVWVRGAVAGTNGGVEGVGFWGLRLSGVDPERTRHYRRGNVTIFRTKTVVSVINVISLVCSPTVSDISHVGRCLMLCFVPRVSAEQMSESHKLHQKAPK